MYKLMEHMPAVSGPLPGEAEMVRYRISMMVLASLAVSLTVAGCTRDVNPVRDAFVSMGAGPKMPPAPDFVVASRTAQHDEYVPVGIRQPPRRYKAKTEEQIKAVEGQLDAARIRTDAQGSSVMREGTTHSGQ